MSDRHRSNPLALAVLICLAERPMHPYEVSTTLRRRQKHESVRLNFGSLYAVVTSLEKRGLIAAEGTHREGRLPERTVYTLTDAGRIELQDWLADLISTPVKDYTAFEAGLSFLPALPPEEAIALLKERLGRLEGEITHVRSMEETAAEQRIPRLFLVEHEYRMALRRAEVEYVHELVDAIESRSLDGVDWWRRIHSGEGPAELDDAATARTENTTGNGSGSLRPGRN